MSRKDPGSSALQRGCAVGAVQCMVAPSVGKIDVLGEQDRPVLLAWEWWLPEARGWPASVVATFGIRVAGGSLGTCSLAWLELAVEVVATVCLTCITISVTAWTSFASEGAWQGAVILGGDAGTVSSTSSLAAFSRSEEGTA